MEEDLLRRDGNSWADTDSRIFAEINLFCLLHEHVKTETALKLRIMEDLFGITEVPDEVLPRLAFFQSAYRIEEKRMIVGFGPAWEHEQNVFSPSFDQRRLFHLIRDYYVSQ